MIGRGPRTPHWLTAEELDRDRRRRRRRSPEGSPRRRGFLEGSPRRRGLGTRLALGTLRGLAYGLCAVLLLLAVGALYLLTPPGQRDIARLAMWGAAQGDVALEGAAFSGTLAGGTLTARRLAWPASSATPAVVIQDLTAAFDLDPLARRVEIPLLAARRAAVDPRAVPVPAEDPLPETEQQARPQLPVSVRLGRLQVDGLTVAGTTTAPVSIAASGGVARDLARSDAVLRLRSPDGTERLDLALATVLAQQRGRVRVTARLPQDGQVQALAALGPLDLGLVELQLDGEVTPQGGQFLLDARSATRGHLVVPVEVDVSRAPAGAGVQAPAAAATDEPVLAAPDLPGALARGRATIDARFDSLDPTLGTVRLAGSLDYVEGQALRIPQLTLTQAGGTLSAAGTLDPQTGQFQAALRLRSDLDAIPQAAALGLAGAPVFDLTLSGTPELANARLVAHARVLEAGPLSLDDLSLDLSATLDQRADQARVVIHQARLAQLTAPGGITVDGAFIAGQAAASPQAQRLDRGQLRIGFDRVRVPGAGLGPVAPPGPAAGAGAPNEALAVDLPAPAAGPGQAAPPPAPPGDLVLQGGSVALSVQDLALPPAADAPAQIRLGPLSIDQVDLGFGQAVRAVTGKAALKAATQADGTLAATGRITVEAERADLAGATLVQPGMGLSAEAALAADLTPHTVTVTPLRLTAGAATLPGNAARLEGLAADLAAAIDARERRVDDVALDVQLARVVDPGTGAALAAGVTLQAQVPDRISAEQPIPRQATVAVTARQSGAGVAGGLTATLRPVEGAPGEVAVTLTAQPEFAADAPIPPEVPALIGDRLALSAVVDTTGQQLRDLSLDLAAGQVQARAVGLQAPYLLEPAQITIPDLSRLPGGATGSLSATAQPTGDGRWQIQATSQGLAAAGRSFGSATLDLTADPADRAIDLSLTTGIDGTPVSLDLAARAPAGEPIQVQRLRATVPGAMVTGEAAIDPAGPLVDGTLTIQADSLAQLGQALDQDLAGAGEVTVDLTARDGRQDVTARGQLRALTAAGARIGQARLSVTGRAVLSDSPNLAAEVALADLAVGGATVASAELSADVDDLLGTPGGAVTLAARDVRSGAVALDTLRLQAEGDLGSGAAWQLATEGQAAGRPLVLAGRGQSTMAETTLAALDGQIAGRDLSLTRPATVAHGPALAVTVPGLTLDQARLSLALTQADGGLGVELTAADVPLNLVQLADPALPALTGTADLTAAMSGPPTAPRGTVALELTGVGTPNSAAAGLPPLALAARARSDGQSLALDATLTSPDQRQRLSVAAETALAPLLSGAGGVPDVRGTVSGSLDITPFAPILEEAGHRLIGQVTVDGRLTGPLDAGGWAVTLTPRDMSYVWLDYGTRLEQLQGAIRLSAAGVTIEDLRATTPGGGTVEADGRYAPLFGPGRTTLQAEVTARNALVADSEEVQAVASADLAATGPLEALSVTGRVVLDRADVTIQTGGEDGRTRLPTLDVEEAGATAAAPGSTPVTAGAGGGGAGGAGAVGGTLDVTLDAGDRLFVRGCGAEVQIGGQVAATGPLQAPSLNGEIGAVEGILNVLSNTWTLDQASVLVRGTLGHDSQLAVAATTETADDVTAIIRVTGPVQDPEITFASVPPLPEDQIIARVLFGRNPTELSPVELASLVQNVNSIRNCGSSTTDSIRNALGLDRLRLTTGDDPSAVGLGAGRYLTDGVYVGVNQGIGSEETEVEVEIDLTDTLKLRSSAGANRSGRVGLSFEYDY